MVDLVNCLFVAEGDADRLSWQKLRSPKENLRLPLAHKVSYEYLMISTCDISLIDFEYFCACCSLFSLSHSLSLAPQWDCTLLRTVRSTAMVFVFFI